MQNKTMGVKREILILVSLLHLFVDFICIGIVASTYKDIHPTHQLHRELVVIIYNCAAFLTQPIFGFFIDKIKDKRFYIPMVLFSGAALIIAAFLAFNGIDHFSLATVLVMLLLGLGNSCFHVVGGKESLTLSKKSTPGGLFVSCGAIGVGLGLLIASPLSKSYIYSLMVSIPIFALCLLYASSRYKTNQDEEDKLLEEQQKVTTPSENDSLKTTLICLTIVCLAIFMRSFLGSYVNHSIKIDDYAGLIFLLSVSAFLGKALGGIIEDHFGPYILIAISGVLGIVSACSKNIILLDYIFIFSVNLLMPFTLNFVRKLFPNKEAFAFGLAAAFLVPGYYMAQFFKMHDLVYMLVTILLVIITTLMLAACCYLRKTKKQCSEK